ncbi:MAG: hypothetical protein HY959_09030 [Ignavibacteriae bacterium]|nr:hypothetical protein [Ignavibacteriota bacterium]
MFDFFQIIDFKNNISGEGKFSFLNNPHYNNIKSTEYKRNYKNSFVTYLERNETNYNFFEKSNNVIFIFGTVYTNNLYEKKHDVKPMKANAEYVFRLYLQFGDDLAKYLKGSFVIIIFDSECNETKIISDRMNVLPLYYAYNDNYFILSSSVRMILDTKLVSKELNKTALTEQIIFDYTLGNKTHFREISRIENGMIYNVSIGGISGSSYWSVENLYNAKLLRKKESLDLLTEQLHYNTNLYCTDADKVLIAVTGGFDGRANLALLERKKDDFLCYSYGMPGSQQVEIPEKICESLNYNFKPVILDEKYELEHDECTLDAIEHSNATAPILRSNYPFAYKNLKNFSDVIITGLFGSEVMRPLHNLGIMINDYSEKLFLSDNPEKELKNIFESIIKKNYLRKEIIESSYDDVWNELKKEYFDKYNKYDKILRFFFFILQEGVRKYFSQEIQIERVYVTTRFPFFDDDFVELMYKTPFAGMYNGFLGKSKFKRRKGQLLYAHIYRRFKPELGRFRLDRGYEPDDLLKLFPFNFISIYKGIRKTSAYKKIKGNDTFNSEKWTEGFIRDTLSEESKYDVFGKGLRDNFENKSYLKDLLKYSHFISLKKYFDSV